jgi:voltage-gated potassium channel Kch
MENRPKELKNTTYELFIGAISLLSILNLGLYYFVHDSTVAGVIQIMDGVLSAIFIVDFLYRFFTAHSKSGYFFRHLGWADFLSSLPLPQFKILRLFRIRHYSRLLSARGRRGIIREFVSNRGGTTLLSLIFLMMLILEFGGLVLLSVESKSPDANIKNASDVLWFIYVTITTVGYGDHYPVTNEGRIIGVVILTAGVGLFSTLTAFLANAFIKPQEEEPPQPADTSPPSSDLVVQLGKVESMLLALERSNDQLKSKLEKLEDLLKTKNT